MSRLFSRPQEPFQNPVPPRRQTIPLVRRCPMCRAVSELVVPFLGLQRFRLGEPVEECFPSLSPVQREVAASGICPACQARLKPSGEEPDPSGIVVRCPQAAEPARTLGAYVHIEAEDRFSAWRGGVPISAFPSYVEAARACFPALSATGELLSWHPADDDSLTFCPACAAAIWLQDPEADLVPREESGTERFHQDLLCDECETRIQAHACAACREELHRLAAPPPAYADEGGALHAECLMRLVEEGQAREVGPGLWQLDAASGVILPGTYGFPEGA